MHFQLAQHVLWNSQISVLPLSIHSSKNTYSTWADTKIVYGTCLTLWRRSANSRYLSSMQFRSRRLLVHRRWRSVLHLTFLCYCMISERMTTVIVTCKLRLILSYGYRGVVLEFTRLIFNVDAAPRKYCTARFFSAKPTIRNVLIRVFVFLRAMVSPYHFYFLHRSRICEEM